MQLAALQEKHASPWQGNTAATGLALDARARTLAESARPTGWSGESNKNPSKDTIASAKTVNGLVGKRASWQCEESHREFPSTPSNRLHMQPIARHGGSASIAVSSNLPHPIQPQRGVAENPMVPWVGAASSSFSIPPPTDPIWIASLAQLVPAKARSALVLAPE